ncbi:hypothetical protein SAMN04487948_11473 [Halogranum amylolyticum]|uniref:Uncharacterized protein n=1 Tax=Halogranum amylolyticum TaxID=660520 RepID=A0A1H8V5Y2_9EURY|nr:hypothetical protein SAMN04487948_11473 [Halogranum amylolyticum]
MADTIQYERRRFGEDIATREESAIRNVVGLNGLEDSIRGSAIRVVFEDNRLSILPPVVLVSLVAPTLANDLPSCKPITAHNRLAIDLTSAIGFD